jgi:hypothetical protein
VVAGSSSGFSGSNLVPLLSPGPGGGGLPPGGGSNPGGPRWHDTSTTLTSNHDPSTVGQRVTFTATVRSLGGGGIPTGSVRFFDDAGYLGTAALRNGQAKWSTAALAAGDWHMVAVYVPDSTHGPSAGLLTQQVNGSGGSSGGGLGNGGGSTGGSTNGGQASSAMSLSDDPDPSTFGAMVTFTASVSGSAGPATGTVSFSATDGSQNVDLGSAALVDGQASVQSDTLDVATWTVTASYRGDGTYAANTATATQVVNKAPTETSLESSVNPSTLGEPVTLTATVGSDVPPDVGIPSGVVVFENNGVPIGAASLDGVAGDDQASITTTDLPAGANPLSAIYEGDDNFLSSSSDTLIQQVNSEPDWTLSADTRSNDPMQGYLLPIGEANVDVNTGNLQLSQPLDLAQSAQARSQQSFALVYNSASVDQPLIVEATLSSGPDAEVPQAITAQLTVDGVPQSPVTFSTDGHQPGDSYLIAVTAPVSGSGEYSWQLDVTVTQADGDEGIDRSAAASEDGAASSPGRAAADDEGSIDLFADPIEDEPPAAPMPSPAVDDEGWIDLRAIPEAEGGGQ